MWRQPKGMFWARNYLFTYLMDYLHFSKSSLCRGATCSLVVVVEVV